jgi:hypothetical protein
MSCNGCGRPVNTPRPYHCPEPHYVTAAPRPEVDWVPLTAATVSAILNACGLEHDSVEFVGDRFQIHVTSRRRSHSMWSYDNLAKAADRIGTTQIDFEWDHGSPGGDVTPGDPKEFCVWIGGRP